MKKGRLFGKFVILNLLAVFAFSSSFFVLPGKAKAANLSGAISGLQDFTGQDVVIGNVTVSPYDGSPNTGWLEVRANNITVNGTINASGAGYGGGGGGGGGATGNSDDLSSGSHSVGWSPLNAIRRGGIGGVGYNGGQNGTDGISIDVSTEEAANGGLGGLGGGPFGGSRGTEGIGGDAKTKLTVGGNGGAGGSGGYKASGTNGDTSIDESVDMGSGGGGGGGAGSGRSDTRCTYNSTNGDVGGGGGGGGGGGNSGGGYVKLIASSNLIINGSIITSGKSGSSGNGISGVNGYCNNDQTNVLLGSGGNGGSAAISGSSAGGAGGTRTGCNGGNESNFCTCSTCPICPAGRGNPCYPGDCCSYGCCQTSYGEALNGGAGGSGGAGAGGGVLLKGNSVDVAGFVDASGGGSLLNNGGTVKVFYLTNYSAGTYYAGRVYVKGATEGYLACTGASPSNAIPCSKDDQGLTVSEQKTLVDSCSSPEGSAPKCEYYCGSGYIRIGSACFLPQQGACGSAVNGLYCSKPENNLCQIGNLSGEVTQDSVSGNWTWKCEGAYGGGMSDSCYAKKSCAYKEVSPN